MQKENADSEEFKMLVRILSSIVLTVVFAAVLVSQLYLPFIFTLFIAFLSVTAANELFGAFSLKEEKALKVFAMISAAAIAFLVKTDYLIIVYVLALVVLFALCLVYYGKQPISKMAAYYMMSLLVASSFSSGILLMGKEDKASGIILFALGLVASWFADIGGYFGGRFFGKRKLCPKISPKKTVEGVIGGFVLSLICFMLVGLLIEGAFNKEISYISLAVISIMSTPISIIGDLTFSVIKRESGIKDYGKLIPGHGGILDRFDGVAFTLPIVFVIDKFLPIL